MSYGNWKSKINNQQPPDDDNTLDTEAMEKDASDFAEAEDATLDEDQIKKQNKALRQISTLKVGLILIHQNSSKCKIRVGK